MKKKNTIILIGMQNHRHTHILVLEDFLPLSIRCIMLQVMLDYYLAKNFFLLFSLPFFIIIVTNNFLATTLNPKKKDEEDNKGKLNL